MFRIVLNTYAALCLLWNRRVALPPTVPSWQGHFLVIAIAVGSALQFFWYPGIARTFVRGLQGLFGAAADNAELATQAQPVTVAGPPKLLPVTPVDIREPEQEPANETAEEAENATAGSERTVESEKAATPDPGSPSAQSTGSGLDAGRSAPSSPSSAASPMGQRRSTRST